MTIKKRTEKDEEKFKKLPIEDIRRKPCPDNIFKKISDISPHPVIITDKTGDILYYNNPAAEFIEPEEERGDKNDPERELPGLRDHIHALCSGEHAADNPGPVEIRDRWGVKRILSLNFTSFADCFKEYFCFNCTDLTEKILSEKALIHSEKDKILILNSVHENLVYYDRDFRIIWANQEPADSVGLKPEELKGRLCYELWYGLDSPCPDCAVKKALESGQPLIEEKLRANGKIVEVAAYPVFGDKGEIIGAVESVLDISRRKMAEQALEETLKKFRELFTTMTNGFVLHEIITDEAGIPCDFRFLDVNPAFEDMTGLFSTEIIGKRVLELFPEYNRDWIERYGRVALTGNPEEFSDYNTAFGKHYHIYAYSPKEGQFAAIFSDVSDLVVLRKEQTRLMMQINRNFEQLAILNDEIRNPLQVITGYALMSDSESSDKIMSQIYAIDKLINELDKRWLESDKIRDYLMKHHSLY